MKKLLFVIVLVAAVFIIFNRQRLFIRDPLGSVTRNGSTEAGTQVYINFSNDVLLENDNAPMYVTLIQKRTPEVIGTPDRIHCVHFVVCLADADIATLAQPATPVTLSQQTGKLVEYIDSENHAVQIKLR